MESINKELERAVSCNDVGKVKILLSAGASVNHIEERNQDTLLHLARSAEVAEELLIRGAQVNAMNTYSETPLHYATAYYRNSEFVRLLLKHGAYVNARNRKGYTPLNHVVKRTHRNSAWREVIKELLEYGADINISSRDRRFDDYCSSLDNAINNPECAKLLIKMTLLKNFNRGGKIINLAPYEGERTYDELSRFIDDCICEIIQMKTDTFDKLSLYEFITEKADKKVLYPNNEKVQNMLANTNYPIYHDIICSKIKLGLDRADLLEKLSMLQIYTYLNVLGQDVKGKKVILNAYSTYNMAKYLSNDDLTNLVEAFYKQSVDSSKNLAEFGQQPDIKLDEATTSKPTCAKRAKLELPSE